MKKTLLCLFALSISCPCFSITTEEIRQPKPALNQLGINYEPENKFEIIKKDSGVEKNVAKLIEDKDEFSNYTYADLSLKKLASEISQDLAMDMDNVLEDVKTLWIGAATRSETISYAMYKLANPDADKPNESVIKKVIKPVANLTSMAGIGVADPILATSAMISGNIMNALATDNKTINYKYSKVTDADMVILVRKIDDLQRILTDKYCDYMSARKILNMVSDITKRREERVNSMTNRSRNEVMIADAYYRESLNYETKKRAEFLAKRSALEQLVGNETLRQFEDNLIQRSKVE